MSPIIPQRSLRNDNAAIIKSVIDGETFIVTRNGVAVAELRPLDGTKSEIVSKATLRNWVGVGPTINFETFRKDLDSAIDSSL
jgi:antitoxin (DNA-binding transcriptional repressor) of toxin-antitoxin stability system